MDREDLFQKARQFDNGKGTPNLELAELYGYMADFHIAMSAERDAEIRQAELESLRRTTCPECGCGI